MMLILRLLLTQLALIEEKVFIFALPSVTQMNMGSLLSLVSLKVSYSCHLREFFLSTVTSGLLN